MADDLEERLKSHARAFDGLLSLIPAKLYYGEDNSDQWQRKKQTKEQKKAARLAKLDPDNVKTAKDVMDERAAAAKKRKRGNEEEGQAASSDIEIDVESEQPKEGLKVQEEQQQKKQKTEKENTPSKPKTPAAAVEVSVEEKQKRKAEKLAAKKERKKAKVEKAKAKRERQKARKTQASANEPTDDQGSDDEEADDAEDGDDDDDDLAEAIDISMDVLEPELKDPSTASPSPSANDPDLDSQPHSASSSISSIQPSTKPESKSKVQPKESSKPNDLAKKTSAEDIRARLQARIEALRTARKADGPNGQPARSRQELLEARRKKEEERKAHKKELRRKAKEEEARKQDEEIARRFSPGGSGSLLASPRSPLSETTSFSFGRVAFNDGTQADATLSSILDPTQKKKGSSDARTALAAAEQKAARLAALDPTKRAEIEQKDMWLNARKRAHGEKIKDDTSLLKKALKRQEIKKGKSEKEWKERKEGVEKSIYARQKKREENLKKRKEDRGAPKSKGGKPNKTKRPGFEGSFKTKHGSKK